MWPFNSKKPTLPDALSFKSAEAFFEYQCKFGRVDIEKGVPLVALIESTMGEISGASESALRGKIQTVLVKVASEDGGFVIPSQTPSSAGSVLKRGDLVLWLPLEYEKTVAATSPDLRFGWVGFVVARIAHTLHLPEGGLDIVEQYGQFH